MIGREAVGRYAWKGIGAFFLYISVMMGQEIPVVPEEEEVDEGTSEQRYDALQELSTLQRLNARFDILQLPGMTHARARAIVSRLGDGSFRIDSIAGSMFSVDSVSSPSRMVEPTPIPVARMSLTLRSTSSFDSRRGIPAEEWKGRHLLRWKSRLNDGSRVDADVSLPTSGRQRSVPQFHVLTTSASGGITAAVGAFQSRERVGLLEDPDARVRSLPDVLALSAGREPFGRASNMEPATNVNGIGLSFSVLENANVRGVLGTSGDSQGRGMLQEFSVCGEALPASRVGLTLIRQGSGRIGTMVSFDASNESSSSRMAAFVRPDGRPRFILSASGDIVREFLFSCVLHSSGLAFGFRWRKARHAVLEAFSSSDLSEESGSQRSLLRAHTLQLNIGDPARVAGRIRFRRTITRGEAVIPSERSSISALSATSTVPVMSRSFLSIHAQIVFLRREQTKDRSSLLVLSGRHSLDGLVLILWVSAFDSAPGGTLWWQHPGYGSWPISAAFSGSGSRAGMHVIRARVNIIEFSAYIVSNWKARPPVSELFGGLMLESKL